MLTGILEWPTRTEGRVRVDGAVAELENSEIKDDPFVPVRFGEELPLRDGLRVEVEVEMKKPRRRRRGKNKRGSSGPREARPVVERFVSIEGMSPEEFANRKTFEDLTSIDPEPILNLEHPGCPDACRLIDMFCPIGRGQRGMIVSPPKAGKTTLLKNITTGILINHPDVKVIALLIDERPEEVTDMEREVKGERCEVISSTFDEPAARHIQVADMVLEKAKRLVESGIDVIIFLDSITRLGRAWNSECPQSGKTLSGGLDANALQKPKAFFGSARKIEEGGSLTILATALIDTGSKMDEVIFEEFKGTGNSEIVLDRKIADKRVFPAIDILKSGTRKEDLLVDKVDLAKTFVLRRILNPMGTTDAIEFLISKLKQTKTNSDFFDSMNT